MKTPPVAHHARGSHEGIQETAVLGESAEYRAAFGTDGVVAHAKQLLIGTRFHPRKPLKLAPRLKVERSLRTVVRESGPVVFTPREAPGDGCQLAA